MAIAKLKIYFTSDTHGFLFPTDYQTNDEKPMGVLKVINDFEKDENTLIFDIGDSIQGSPFTDFMWKSLDKCLVAEAFNTGKYDYFTLGNHDFNYGYDKLSKYLNAMNAKCILANVVEKTQNLPITPYNIKTLANGIKVGIVGITSDRLPLWEKPEHLANFEIKDAFETAKNTLEKIKDLCDVSICIYHGGYEADLLTGKIYEKGKENIGYKICKELGFDVLLTAHQHMQTPMCELNGTFTMQTPPNGLAYGKMELEIESGKVISCNGELKAPSVEKQIKASDELLSAQVKVQKYLDTPVGNFDCSIPMAQKLDLAINGSPFANFVNEVILNYSGADIACVGLANTLFGLNKELTIRDLMIAYPYANNIKTIKVDGITLKKGLERCAEYFDIKNGEICISDKFLIPKVEHYNYDFFSGITYNFKIGNAVGERVTQIKYKGTDIKESDTFTLALSSYRATGTGGYGFYTRCEQLNSFADDVQQLLIQYVQKNKYIEIPQKSSYTIEV